MIPHAAIRNALRKLWLFSPTRREAKRAARIAPGIYLCAECLTGNREIDIDHIQPVGATPGSRMGKDRTWDSFMFALFIGQEGLRAICKNCHSAKTRGKVETGEPPREAETASQQTKTGKVGEDEGRVGKRSRKLV